MTRPPPNPRLVTIGAIMDDIRRRLLGTEGTRNRRPLEQALDDCILACVALKIDLADFAEESFSKALVGAGYVERAVAASKPEGASWVGTYGHAQVAARQPCEAA